MHRDGIAQMSHRLGLRFEIENLPGSIVIQRQFRPQQLIRTLRGFRKSFIDRAPAVDDDARPRSLRFHAILSPQCKTRGKESQRGYPRELHHVLLYSLRNEYPTISLLRWHT